jgi:hypothetical protein
LLYIAFVVVVRASVACGLELEGIGDHFGVEVVEDGVIDYIFDGHKVVSVESSSGELQIRPRKEARGFSSAVA